MSLVERYTRTSDYQLSSYRSNRKGPAHRFPCKTRGGNDDRLQILIWDQPKDRIIYCLEEIVHSLRVSFSRRDGVDNRPCHAPRSRLSVSGARSYLSAGGPSSYVPTEGILPPYLLISYLHCHVERDSPSPRTTAPISAPLPSLVLSVIRSSATESHPVALINLKSRLAIRQRPILLSRPPPSTL